MAVVRLFYRAQFGKSLADLREVEQRIVSESVVASGRVQNEALSGAAECLNRLAVAGHGEPAYESRGAFFRRDACEFAQRAGIIRFVVAIAIAFDGVRFIGALIVVFVVMLVVMSAGKFIGGIAGGAHSGSAAQRVNLQARVVAQNQFAGNGEAVRLRFLARVVLVGGAVFDDLRLGR